MGFVGNDDYEKKRFFGDIICEKVNNQRMKFFSPTKQSIFSEELFNETFMLIPVYESF